MAIFNTNQGVKCNDEINDSEISFEINQCDYDERVGGWYKLTDTSLVICNPNKPLGNGMIALIIGGSIMTLIAILYVGYKIKNRTPNDTTYEAMPENP